MPGQRTAHILFQAIFTRCGFRPLRFASVILIGVRWLTNGVNPYSMSIASPLWKLQKSWIVPHMCTGVLHTRSFALQQRSRVRGYAAQNSGSGRSGRSVGGDSGRTGALLGSPDIEWIAESPRALFRVHQVAVALNYFRILHPLKDTSHVTIFMRGMRAKGKIQRNNYQYGQRGLSFAGKTSSVSLIAYSHARKIAEWEVALSGHWNPSAVHRRNLHFSQRSD